MKEIWNKFLLIDDKKLGQNYLYVTLPLYLKYAGILQKSINNSKIFDFMHEPGAPKNASKIYFYIYHFVMNKIISKLPSNLI